MASERGYEQVRDGIANVMADLSESLHGVRIVTAHNRQRRNVVRHRNVVGEYRDANDYTAQINAVYGPGTQMSGSWARRCCWPSAATWCCTTTCHRAPWWPSSCT